jgi:starvation-inducible outer membrane lipoprotein
MKKITVMVLALALAGCATAPLPKPAPHKTVIKHQEPCPCSPTANQVVQKRWFGGWKFFH